MQLHFLGKSYNTTANSIEGIDTQETAKFLGQRYSLRRYDIVQKQSASQDLRFLGRRYQA